MLKKRWNKLRRLFLHHHSTHPPHNLLQILYPVPRYLYNPPPHILEVVSKSARNKLTTVQPEYTGVDVQFDATRTFVNCMIKGGKARHNVKNDGRGDYLASCGRKSKADYLLFEKMLTFCNFSVPSPPPKI